MNGWNLIPEVLESCATERTDLFVERWILPNMGHDDDLHQKLTHPQPGKMLAGEHSRVKFLNGFSCAPEPSVTPSQLLPDYRPFYLCLGCVSNTRPPEGLYENLVRIVAMAPVHHGRPAAARTGISRTCAAGARWPRPGLGEQRQQSLPLPGRALLRQDEAGRVHDGDCGQGGRGASWREGLFLIGGSITVGPDADARVTIPPVRRPASWTSQTP